VNAAETLTALTMKAVFALSTNKSGTATVTLTGSGGGNDGDSDSAITGLTVNSEMAGVVKGSPQRFSATVTGMGGTPASVSGGGNGTGISADGLLTVTAAGRQSQTSPFRQVAR